MEYLKPGDAVWVKCSEKEKGKRGSIVEVGRDPDSYEVRVEGTTVRRNRKHLRKMNMEQPIERQQPSSSEESESDQGSEEEDSGEEDSLPEKESEVKPSSKTSRPTRTKTRKHLSTDFEWE